MKRLLAVSLLFTFGLLAQTPSSPVTMGSAPDVTGTGAAVQVFGSTTILARWFLVIADPANANPVRCGDSLVSATRGNRVAAGGGWGYHSPGVDSRQTVAGYYYDLSSVWCYIATGDIVSLSYAK